VNSAGFTLNPLLSADWAANADGERPACDRYGTRDGSQLRSAGRAAL